MSTSFGVGTFGPALHGPWYFNGTTYVQTINVNARLVLSFTGTSFGITVAIATSFGPSIIYSVDGGKPITRSLSSSDTDVTLVSGLVDGLHTINLATCLISFSGGSSLWDGTYYLRLSAVIVDTGKTLVITRPPNGEITFIGDSITCAYSLFVFGEMDNWCEGLAARFYAGADAIGFSSQAYTGTPGGGVPAFIGSYGYYYSGQPRSFTPSRRTIVLNMGQNGVAQSDAYAFLVALRASDPTARIKQCVPFSQVGVAAITAAVAQYQSAYPLDTRVSLIDLGLPGKAIMDDPLSTPDGVHPNNRGCREVTDLLYPHLVDCFPPLLGQPGGSTLPT